MLCRSGVVRRLMPAAIPIERRLLSSRITVKDAVESREARDGAVSILVNLPLSVNYPGNSPYTTGVGEECQKTKRADVSRTL